MKKRIFYMVIALMLTVITVAVPCLPAKAEEEELGWSRVEGATDTQKFYDYADEIYDESEKEINDKLMALSKKYNIDVVGVICDDYPAEYAAKGDPIREFAMDFYAYADYYHEGQFCYDGIIFMLTLRDRSYALVSTGFVEGAIDSEGTEYIFGQVREDLSEDYFATAFREYANQVDVFMEAYEKGEPYINGKVPRTTGDWILYIGIVVGLALLIAFIRVSSLKADLKSVAKKTTATDYIVPGSLSLRKEKDYFLYRTTTRVKIESSSSSSGRSSSSSGRSFSGSSGHF